MSVSRMAGRLLSIIYLLALMPTTASAGVFDNYSGTWSGSGEVVLKDGRQETINCKIWSTIEVDGTRAYHKVKCENDNNKINVRLKLIAENGGIIGDWSASGAVEGLIQGTVSGNSLNLQLSGRKISATLKLSASNCRQKMSLTGRIGKITKLSVRLKKDC